MNSVFAVNPEVTTLFVFEDGNAFIEEADAIRYAKQSKAEYKVVHKEEKEEKVKSKKSK